MAIPLEKKDLTNLQQMEVAVNGPDGATHLIICTGVANLGSNGQETYIFPVGPRLSRRQFVAVIASGALSQFQKKGTQSAGGNGEEQMRASLLSIIGDFDEETGRVRVSANVSLGTEVEKAAICYNVNILAELPSNLRIE